MTLDDTCPLNPEDDMGCEDNDSDDTADTPGSTIKLRSYARESSPAQVLK